MTEIRLLAPLLEFATVEAIKLTNAERGYVVLPGADGRLDFRVKRDRQGREIQNAEDQISKTALTKVLKTGEPLILRDAMGDQQFSLSLSVMNLHLRSLMCVPLITQGRVIGAFYVENRSVRGRFTEEDLPPLVLFANQAAAAIENAALNEALEAKVLERTHALHTALVRLQGEIEERQRIEDELRRLATFDSLTNVFNRRSFFEQAELYFTRALQYSLPLTVLMLDLDRFKQINDRFGHIAGDRALKHFATLCYDNIQEFNILGRLGGEEFAILLPEIPVHVAVQIGEHLCKMCATTPLSINEQTILLTVSIGVASLNTADKVFDQLIERADKCMYLAKHNGGNSVMAVPTRPQAPASITL